MTPAFALAVLLAAVPARAGDDPGLENACENEIGLFCAGKTGIALRRCLSRNREDAMPACRALIRARGLTDDEQPVAPETAGKPSAERETRVVAAKGAVYLHRAGGKEGEFISISSGTPLVAGDWLRIGLDGAAELALDGATSVGLSSGTDLALTSLSKTETELRLALGSLTAKVAKLGYGRRFRVRTPTAVCAVRGTEFIVEQDEAEGDSRVAVVDEGEVEVSAASGGDAVILRPRQETAVRRDAPAPEAPRALAAMRARAEDFAAFRVRAERSAKTWTPLPPAAREQARAQLANRPGVQAGSLTGVRPQQKTGGTPPSFQTGNRRGGQPGDQRGGQPGGQRGGQPGGQRGGQPGMQPGGRPGDQRGGQPGMQPGGQPGNQRGGQPGGQPGGRPGGQQGGQQQGGQQGGQPGGQPDQRRR